MTTIENDISYLLFVDHEEDMKNFTHLQPVVKDLAKLVERHIEDAVRKYQMDIIPTIAQHLQDEVGAIVMGHNYHGNKKTEVQEEETNEEVTPLESMLNG